MYGIAPDDRLWLVQRDQDERRQAVAADRIAAAARRGGEEPSPREETVAGGRRGWAAVRLVRRSHWFGHALAHHGAAR
ncbi:MAG: hypothetical protein MUE82_08495 [Chloroflexi bacterium]|jgi:hypothetical protein|nr:hypothetical protein [Chloroflexota bacterium]